MYNPTLTTFIAVAENGSFTKAADILFITPTAVMKQINTLEERLGITLFERTNHGLHLSEAGKSFLQDARYIKDYSDKAIEKAKDIDDKSKQQSIRIGTSIMTPVKFLMDEWVEIQKFNPRLKIELVPFENTPINSVEILKNLGKHIDVVAGLYDDSFLEERGCKAAYLYDKKLLFAIPVIHPLCEKSKIEIADLKGQKVLMIRKNWNEYVDRLREYLTTNGVIVEEFNSFNLAAYNKAAQENAPIITVEGWQDVHPLLKIIPADWEYSVPFGILYSPTPTKQVKDFIDTLIKINKDKQA
ncbi:MAG: LysR family transcriptional regulator, partial [Clostridia bacterium]|nr:LysR family transcriptional regulator [Clostridia bacterium]MDE7328899.1 LysR family transcriptional regulator [Clostridia bacterium]